MNFREIRGRLSELKTPSHFNYKFKAFIFEASWPQAHTIFRTLFFFSSYNDPKLSHNQIMRRVGKLSWKTRLAKWTFSGLFRAFVAAITNELSEGNFDLRRWSWRKLVQMEENTIRKRPSDFSQGSRTSNDLVVSMVLLVRLAFSASFRRRFPTEQTKASSSSAASPHLKHIQ